jgi:Mlc titration factor MtfA (ptsG expression regulator)
LLLLCSREEKRDGLNKMFGIIEHFRRKSAAKLPFPEEWREILQKSVPFYRKLSPEWKEKFEEKLKVFFHTKYFIPAGGMEITDEVKVVISAAAARLIMNMPDEHYQRLTEIIVYPSHYKHPDKDGSVIYGEAHDWGTVVLSYQAVLSGLQNPSDGHETAGHEFAHVLDRADGAFDGTPELDASGCYKPWANTMSQEFFALRERDEEDKKSTMRSYGATNEAEFFAVATETFFEKPQQLKTKHPEMYQLLINYYNLDPLDLEK